ncbi:MAG: hypothetical protein ABSC94_28285 [Polyangiaceae bacterium]
MAPSVHVATPPEMHAFSPGVHVFEQVDEHAAAGGMPAHDIGAVQPFVAVTVRHPFGSAVQVATVRLS